MYSIRKQKNSNQNSSNRPVIIGLLVLLFIAGTMLVLEKSGVTNFYEKSPTSTNQTAPASTINFGPPTEEEAESGDEQKEEIIRQEESQSTEPQAIASVIIVDANQYGDEVEVRAFASNIIQDGTCTFVFTKDNLSLEKSAPANADASSTPCIAQIIPRSEFSEPGTWQLTVTYEGGSAKGSVSTTVEIQ